MRGRLSAIAVTLTAACMLAACDGGSSDDADPTPTGPSGLPALEDGRLVRVLGNGTDEPMHGVAYAPDTSVSAPALLVSGTENGLIGLQRAFPALFTLSPDGTTRVVNEDGSFNFSDSRPVAGVARSDELLMLEAGDEDGALVRVDLTNAQRTEVASLAEPSGETSAGAVLNLPDATYVQWGSSWWRLPADGSAEERVRPIEAPVEGALVSARTASGVAVLTSTELVHLDESLQVVDRSQWSVPEGSEDQTVSAAVGDGSGGLVVTMMNIGSGTVAHVTHDGVTVLASGFKPDHTTPSTNCEDGSTSALQSNLGYPVSIALWQGRLVIADEMCHSLLQLPLPDAA